MDASYQAEERRLIALWERHVRFEFADRDAAATVDTMSDENYVNHVPVMTGGRGRDRDAGVLREALHPEDAG